MYRTIGKALALGLALVVCFASFGSTTAHAASMTLQVQGSSILNGASCAASGIGYSGSLQGTDNDRFIGGSWFDFTVFIVSDAKGTPLLAVWISINNPSGVAPLSFGAGALPFNLSGNTPAARPFRLDYYDIGDPGMDVPILDATFLSWVKSNYSPTVSQSFDPVAYGITSCSSLPLVVVPIDDRLNYEAVSGPVAIYCNEPGLDIYEIDPQTGKGHLAIRIEQDKLDALPAAPATNTLLASAGNVSVYQLTTGELQVVAGPDFEGKMYGYVFNGCPYAGGGYKVDV